MKEIYQKAAKRAKEGRPFVLATVIRQRGPSPRGIGTKCLIFDDGSMEGTIGGGLLEARAVEESRKVLETRSPVRLYFSLTGSDVEETDMLCGGQVEVFLEPVGPDDSDRISALRNAAKVMGRGGSGLMALVVDERYWRAGRNSRFFVHREGEAFFSESGTGEVEKELQARFEGIIGSGRPDLLAVPDGSGSILEIFVEPVFSRPVLYVFGGGHVSRQIIPLAAGVGFETVVIEDRENFADGKMFPDAGQVLLMSFNGAVEKLPVNDASYLVIVTRGHMHDKVVLEQALKTGARYIGMIGSRRKRDIIYGKLLEEGYTEEDLARVNSPIGLEIGAETPEEIAVSIVAELIKVRAGV